VIVGASFGIDGSLPMAEILEASVERCFTMSRTMTSRSCKHCGVTADASEVTCPACGNVLPFKWSMIGLNDLALRKIGLTVLIPLLVWKAMTALLGSG
jgi:hypothetical protein